MAAALTEEEFLEFVGGESDFFRLVIRGHAAIDGKLDEILDDAFVASRPAFLRGPSFKNKLDLAVALGLVPVSYVEPIMRLTKLRNDFAHGTLTELKASRAKEVARSIKPMALELEVSAITDKPFAMLAMSLIVIWFALRGCEATARQHRVDVEAALERQRLGGNELAFALGKAKLGEGRLG